MDNTVQQINYYPVDCIVWLLCVFLLDNDLSGPSSLKYSKWFEPRSITSSYCVIVRVSVVLKRTVVGD